MIEVKHLTKTYGDHCAVDDLSFTVEDGQIYGFLGPNGAGKSTTMNIMTGYLAPTSGDVIINGHDILEEPEEAKRTIGYLPEIPPVYTDMTVAEYLKFCAELKKVPRAERKDAVRNAIDELELGEVRNRLIRNLSKGFRQRVGFAQAIIANPETLILDEPTVGLDPKQIIEIRQLIRRLGQKHTVILSSHILSEVAEVCDQVLIINHGKFVACDSPDHLAMSEQKQKGSILHVTAQGARADVLAALRSVVQVTDSDLTEDEDGNTVATIRVPGGSDIRGRVSQALFAKNCVVLSMSVEKASLENIFLELTDSGKEAAPVDEKAKASVGKMASDLVHDELGIESYKEDGAEDAEQNAPDEKSADQAATEDAADSVRRDIDSIHAQLSGNEAEKTSGDVTDGEEK
ncbi:MAG: ABC transporter ATP-binding protein [Chordicoccus sp.]